MYKCTMTLQSLQIKLITSSVAILNVFICIIDIFSSMLNLDCFAVEVVPFVVLAIQVAG